MISESIPIGISLPRKILHRIDLERKDISRSRYVLRLIEKASAVENETVMKKLPQPGSRVSRSIHQSAIVDTQTATESSNYEHR
jgi:hypothetical protein